MDHKILWNDSNIKEFEQNWYRRADKNNKKYNEHRQRYRT